MFLASITHHTSSKQSNSISFTPFFKSFFQFFQILTRLISLESLKSLIRDILLVLERRIPLLRAAARRETLIRVVCYFFVLVAFYHLALFFCFYLPLLFLRFSFHKDQRRVVTTPTEWIAKLACRLAFQSLFVPLIQ